ncbi:MAG: competence/damage-inducible protein A [Rhodospirillaceae bacterium]|nr:competence/damage-inducible protein A [Rhodospirillaceae bacterium]|tara:strand:- start:9873 stop:10634 length:762 start_codon:yes stop_codon:yes gene_type:complete
MSQTVTAAVLVIGNEILSGRTQDTNVAFLGKSLNDLGIRLMEVRVVADIEDEIVYAVNALRVRYDYLFTTGGIGPTHDDITADSVAAAFDVGIDYHPEVFELLKQNFESRGLEANGARMRMARVPDGALLIDNEISLAPGFQIENVFVLAGVPSIARAMFNGASNRLRRGEVVRSRSIRCHCGEGTIADTLAVVQDAFPVVDIGSYPWSKDGRYGTSLVLRATDIAMLDSAYDAVFQAAVEAGGDPVEEPAEA